MMKFLNLQKSLILLTIVLISSCKKTNWNENFSEKEKSPFGTYVLFNEAPSLLKNHKIIKLKKNFYDYILDKNRDSTKTQSYVLVKDAAFRLSKEATQELLSFVKEGNSAFLALNYFNNDLKNALAFTTNSLHKKNLNKDDLKKLKGNFYLKNTDFKEQSYQFERNIRKKYFLQYADNKTVVLGTILIDGEQVPNFIKVYHGKGAFYLHLNPVVFTNYYLLSGKESYTANVLSYLPQQDVLWDLHLKTSKYIKEKKPSIFKFFLQHETLTWFLTVSLIGLLLFMLFNARRKQRAIPQITPLHNTTVAFTQTIANLYLSEANHKNLVDKKIVFFLEKVRTKYLLNTVNLNKDFITKLAAKSGNQLQKTKYLINTINTLHKKTECSEEELIVLHKMIENFFKK